MRLVQCGCGDPIPAGQGRPGSCRQSPDIRACIRRSSVSLSIQNDSVSKRAGRGRPAAAFQDCGPESDRPSVACVKGDGRAGGLVPSAGGQVRQQAVATCVDGGRRLRCSNRDRGRQRRGGRTAQGWRASGRGSFFATEIVIVVEI